MVSEQMVYCYSDILTITTITISFRSEKRLSPLVLGPQMGLLYQSLMMDEYGASVEW
jgi:hypothetical protein